MIRLHLAMAVITATIASTAFAEPVPGTATLAAPAAQARIVGESGIWRCNGTTCTGPADARTGLAVAACTLLAGANGRVAAFTAGPTVFGEAELKRCNRHVRG